MSSSVPASTGAASHEEVWDVVVVGAGAGGMTAACIAAAEGRSVLLLEQADVVGGTHRDFRRYGVDTRQPHRGGGGAGRQPGGRAHLSAADRSRHQPGAARNLSHPWRRGAARYRSAHVRAAAAGADLSRLLSRPAGRDLRRPRARAGAVRRARPGTSIRAAARPVAGVHAVRRHDDQPPGYSSLAARREIAALGDACEQAVDQVRFAAVASAAWHNALSRQCARSAAVALSARLRRQHSHRHGGAGLLPDAQSRVTMLDVADASGRRSRIHARRGVVLATGGISHDADLRRTYVPDSAGQLTATAASGPAPRGARLAAAIGARLSDATTDGAFWVPAVHLQAARR